MGLFVNPTLVPFDMVLWDNTNREDIVCCYPAKYIAEMSSELIKCGSCEAMIPSSAKFCPKCSAKLALLLNIVDTIKCSKCGAKNRSDDRYCLNCGYPLHIKKDLRLSFGLINYFLLTAARGATASQRVMVISMAMG